jgi:hypothetical protein
MRFAHRGVVRRAPENTVEAILAAYEVGCEGVEVDVRSTRDGRIVLAHDATVERIVSGGPNDGDARRIGELTWGLEEPRRMLFEVECKEPGLALALREIFEGLGGAERCVLFSGDEEVVEELVKVFPSGRRTGGLRIGANVRRLTGAARERITRGELDVIDLDAFETTRQEVEELIRAGCMVLSNLGDIPEWWRNVVDWEFHGLKSNYAEEYTDWLRSRDAR